MDKNFSLNIMRSKFYVCPTCNNIIHSLNEAEISCCGNSLKPLIAKEIDEHYNITIEKVEDEHFITVNHPMTKEHFISFMAYVTFDKVQFIKLYPEGNAEARFNLRGKGNLYIYCNIDGLMKIKI
ncbi:MAG: hypothetical protein E7365_01880 [Clostridiales bacterium]|nr:hypothetical protein [Clostridiales bacterium]